MNNHNIKPDKITKPIQLLAAWLIGLILLVSALLTAACNIVKPQWAPAFFSISAVAIIPIFLILIFLLQTKYRPQMQEDEYYSLFLNKNTMEKEPIVHELLIEKMTDKIDEKIIQLSTITQEQITVLNESLTSLSLRLEGEAKLTTSISPVNQIKEFIKETNNVVAFNVKLEHATAIRVLLREKNIKLVELFGEFEEQKQPEIFMLSFGSRVDYDTLILLIEELLQFGLSHLRIIEEQFRQNYVYIGSYAYKGKNKKAIITPHLFSEIMNSSSSLEIYTHVIQHME